MPYDLAALRKSNTSVTIENISIILIGASFHSCGVAWMTHAVSVNERQTWLSKIPDFNVVTIASEATKYFLVYEQTL
jgi:hypothetical protein